MSYFRRFVTPMVSAKGTRYTVVVYDHGRCDITIKGVTFRNMKVEEEQYLHFNF